MNINTLFGQKLEDITKIIHFPSKIKSQILTFSTNNLDRTSTKLKWNIVNTKNTNQGDVNTHEKLYNVIGMRLLPFRMRTYDTTLTPTFPRWYIGIEEFATQSFISSKNYLYHFISNLDLSNRQGTGSSFYKEMQTFPFNQGYFWFNDVIKVINSITLNIFNVFDKLDINIVPQQTTNSIVVQNSNPLTFTISNSNIFTGDIVTITGFTTGDPITDAALITSVNNYQSYIYINSSGTTAYINIDASSMTPTGSTLNITVTTTPYVLTFPIEFIYYD